MYRGLPTSEADLPRPQNSSSASLSRHRVIKDESRRANGSPANLLHHDPESKPARRRIQLACVRCRKRKIKCSGEQSDGSGCTNCKTANHENCEFLRVQSTRLEPRPESGVYPQAAVNPPVTTATSSSHGNHFVQSVPSTMSPSMCPMPDTTRSQSLSDLGHYSQFVPWPRGPLYGNGFIEDIYAAPYGPPSPSYIQPSSASASHAGYYGTPVIPKAWDTAAGIGRYQTAAFYTEADTSPSLGHNIALTSGNRHSSVSNNDIPSLFPVMNLLSNGDGFAGRVLPTPTSDPPHASNSTSPSDSELIGSGLPVITGDLSVSFNDRLNSTTSCRSKSLTDLVASGIGTLPLLKSDSPPPSQDYMNYMSISSCSSAAPITSSVFSQSDTVEESNDSEESLVMSMGGTGLKGSPSNSSPYGYGTGERPSNSDSGNLLGSQQYFRVKQPNPVAYNQFSFLQSSTPTHGLPSDHHEC